MDRFEQLKVYMDYMIQIRALQTLPSYWCIQTRNYEGFWDSHTYTAAWDRWLYEVPKLETHYLCGPQHIWTFEEFISEQSERHYCPDRIETYKPIDKFLTNKP